MISLTDMEYRLADHAARVGRVNADWWIWEGLPPTRARRGRAVTSVVGQLRRTFAEALVRVGGWVDGAPGGRTADPAAEACSTLDAVR